MNRLPCPPRKDPPSVPTFFILISFCACLSAVGAPPLEASEAAVETAEFDWRAFLAPFHTVTLHLPIGFLAILFLLELYSFRRSGEGLRDAIALVVWASALSAVLVSTLGWFRGSGGGYDAEMLRHHEIFGFSVAGATVVMAVLHTFAFRRSRKSGGLPWAYRGVLALSLVLITITGHGGGNLTHGSQYLVENAPPWVREWLVALDSSRSVRREEVTSGFYAETIRPAFEEKCFSCHGPEKQQGGYRMDTLEGLLAAGESELAPIVPGRPLESYLVELVTLPADDEFAMPPEGKVRLSPEETLQLIQWIWEGAEVEGQ